MRLEIILSETIFFLQGKLLGKAVELEELGDSEGTIINSEVEN